jgi:hypothetical protein
MKELLERWAKLEPTRCEGVYRGEGVFSVYVHLGREERVYRIVHDLVESANAANSWLQAAVQEAIEARGWMGDLEFTAGRAGAVVFTPEPFTATGTTAAEVLLGAYLTALEAQA